MSFLGEYEAVEELTVDFSGRTIMCIIAQMTLGSLCCGGGRATFVIAAGFTDAALSDIQIEGRAERLKFIEEGERGSVESFLKQKFKGMQIVISSETLPPYLLFTSN